MHLNIIRSNECKLDANLDCVNATLLFAIIALYTVPYIVKCFLHWPFWKPVTCFNKVDPDKIFNQHCTLNMSDFAA